MPMVLLSFHNREQGKMAGSGCSSSPAASGGAGGVRTLLEDPTWLAKGHNTATVTRASLATASVHAETAAAMYGSARRSKERHTTCA